MIPNDYVQNIGERLALYHQLNAYVNEEELETFKQEITDRFGSIPEQTKELIRSLPLKWLAKELGFQKLVIKSGKMIGHFLADQDSEYFSSPVFHNILTQIQYMSKDCVLKQKGEKLTLVFSSIKTIKQAKTFLNKLQLNNIEVKV